MADEAAVETIDAGIATDAAPEPDLNAELAKWKQMSRKWEGTAKQNAEAAKRLAEMEEAQKTAEQKAADKAATTERERDAAKLDALRLSVALDKGLTRVQAKRLIGATEEELAADADELLASFARPEPAPEPGPALPTRPKEALKSGSTQAASTDPPQLTREDIKGWKPEDIEAARVAGQLDKALGIVK